MTLERLRALLAARGIRPRKSLGQNFLFDPNFARAVARDAAPDGGTLCVEVGPGAGALTRALLEAHPGARVLAVELDGKLAALMREEFAAELAAGRLTLLEGDALSGKHGLNARMIEEGRRISRAEARPRRVLAANLPYNAATPLIANLALLQEPFVERIVATVQLELAKRLFGAPGSADYGPLAAFLALRAEGAIVRRVGPEVFWPRPGVSSAVVALNLKEWEACAVKAAEARTFMDFLQKLFQHRRKTLRAALKNLGLGKDDPKAKARGEDLAAADLLAIWRESVAIENRTTPA